MVIGSIDLVYSGLLVAIEQDDTTVISNKIALRGDFIA